MFPGQPPFAKATSRSLHTFRCDRVQRLGSVERDGRYSLGNLDVHTWLQGHLGRRVVYVVVVEVVVVEKESESVVSNAVVFRCTGHGGRPLGGEIPPVWSELQPE